MRNVVLTAALMCASIGAGNVAMAAGPLEFSGAKVALKKWRIGEAKGKFYMNFEVLAKLTAAVDAKALMTSKFVCKVGALEVVDTPLVLGGSKLKDMAPGQSTKLSMMGFGIRNAMDTKPNQCVVTLTASSGYGAKKQTTELASFCWTGKAVTVGACPK